MSEKKTNGSRTLVLGYMEMVSSRIFSSYSKQLTDLVGKKHGVYALYKGSRLYYVGLAINLKNRIKHHLRDKHSGKWDKFSLYLVRKEAHIKELESIVMRIASPAGNASTGRLPRADNLKKQLDKAVSDEQKRERETLFSSRKSPGTTKKRTSKPKKLRGKGEPTLAPYITAAFKIRGTYKGKTFEARVRKSGKINFNGRLYNSPSVAGYGARGRAANGWTFWRFKNKKGEWVRLDELRK